MLPEQVIIAETFITLIALLDFIFLCFCFVMQFHIIGNVIFVWRFLQESNMTQLAEVFVFILVWFFANWRSALLILPLIWRWCSGTASPSLCRRSFWLCCRCFCLSNFLFDDQCSVSNNINHIVRENCDRNGFRRWCRSCWCWRWLGRRYHRWRWYKHHWNWRQGWQSPLDLCRWHGWWTGLWCRRWLLILLDVLDTCQSWDVLFDIVIFADLADHASNGQNHPIRLEDGLGHGVGHLAHGLCLVLVRVHVVVMTTLVPGWPVIQQLHLVTDADGPVREGGLARQVVDPDPGQDDCAGCYRELLVPRVQRLVQWQKRQNVILGLNLNIYKIENMHIFVKF